MFYCHNVHEKCCGSLKKENPHELQSLSTEKFHTNGWLLPLSVALSDLQHWGGYSMKTVVHLSVKALTTTLHSQSLNNYALWWVVLLKCVLENSHLVLACFSLISVLYKMFNFLKDFLKIQIVISGTTAPILGLFVLFECIFHAKSKLCIFGGKSWEKLACFQHVYG